MNKAKVIKTIDANTEKLNITENLEASKEALQDDGIKTPTLDAAIVGEVISEECVVIKNGEMNGTSEISCEDLIGEGSVESTGIEAGDEEISKKAALKEKKKERIGKTKLCKLVKKDYLKKHLDDYKELVAEPAWLCLKCGRTAKEMKSLHKPVALFTADSDEDQTVL